MGEDEAQTKRIDDIGLSDSQDLVLGLKESKIIVRNYLTDPSKYFKFIDELFKPWEQDYRENCKIEQIRLIYLMGHLCLENKMDAVLRTNCFEKGREERMRKALSRLTFSVKIKLLDAAGLPAGVTSKDLTRINEARNNAAHNIDFSDKKYNGEKMLDPGTIKKFRENTIKAFNSLNSSPKGENK